jgi:uncharacterized membrane protein YeaQ/YmgE (transglycosylase-associated protein family)
MRTSTRIRSALTGTMLLGLSFGVQGASAQQLAQEVSTTRGSGMLAGVLSWLVIGVAVALVVRLLMPGAERVSLLHACLLGIVGASIGGVLASVVGLGSLTGLSGGGLAVAVAGAMMLLLASRLRGAH